VPARLHPGAVRHVWDHFVLGLRGPAGDAVLSLYAIAWSPEVGGGHVAFLTLPDGSARAWADVAGLGARMQARLSDLGMTGPALDSPVVAARFTRHPSDPTNLAWTIEGDKGGLEARWLRVRPAVWTEGPAPAFWDREDIWCAFVDAPAASLVLDGAALPGEPWLDEVWVPKLGVALWSAHVALAEVRVEPVRGTMPG
jgi:hypothetical protein